MSQPFPHCPNALPDGRTCTFAKGHGGGHHYEPAPAATGPGYPGPVARAPAVTSPSTLPGWLPWAGLAGVAFAFIVGIALGAVAAGGGDTEHAQSGAVTASTTVTEVVSAADAEQAALDKRAKDLDGREAKLDERKTGLEERAGELDERESALVADEQAVEANTVDDGIWTVGTDMKPGTYRATDVSADCYWAILVSGSNGADIVNNGIPGGGSPTVTVQDGHDFETSRCGEWKLAQ